jgi:hypothetical protein
MVDASLLRTETMRKTSSASFILTLTALGAAFAACSSDPAEDPGDSASGPTSNTTATTNGTTGTTGAPTTTTSGATATTGATTTTANSTSATTTGTTTSTTTTGGTTTGTSSTTTATTTTGTSSTTGGSGCATLTGPVERSGAYVLEFGDIYFAVDAAGGKVIEFKRAGGSNLFTTSAIHETNFGSTLWTAPQVDWDWPPVTAIDSDPYTVDVDETAGVISMTSMGTPSVGPNVTVTKVFTANLCDETIDITYTVTNSGTDAAGFAPWEVTRVVPGGLSFWGAEEGLLGASVLEAEYVIDTYWFDHMVDTEGDRKLFSEGTQGYLAFTDGTDLFVKSFSDVPASGHPPDHGEIEVYEDAADGYVELEVVGSYAEIAAGASATLAMRWYLRPMPEGATRTVGDAALKAAVADLIAP